MGVEDEHSVPFSSRLSAAIVSRPPPPPPPSLGRSSQEADTETRTALRRSPGQNGGLEALLLPLLLFVALLPPPPPPHSSPSRVASLVSDLRDNSPISHNAPRRRRSSRASRGAIYTSSRPPRNTNKKSLFRCVRLSPSEEEADLVGRQRDDARRCLERRWVGGHLGRGFGSVFLEGRVGFPRDVRGHLSPGASPLPPAALYFRPQISKPKKKKPSNFTISP